MRFVPLVALLFLAPQDSQERALERLRTCMSEGRFIEGRAVAALIVKTFPGTPAAQTARPYTEDNAFLTMAKVEFRGPLVNRVDLTVMADGIEYDDRSQKGWQREGDTIFKLLFKTEVLAEYESYFNLFRANVASKDSRLSRRESSAVTFFKGREEFSEIAADRTAAREVAGMTGSTDRLAIVQVRPAGHEHGLSKMGVALVGSPRPTAPELLHAFGHSFAGLGDEAPSLRGWGGMEKSQREPPPIPAAPNVSDSKDPACLPWQHWLKAKAEGDKRASKVDVLEGAALRPTKAWRPVDESLCVMNAGTNFCPVCREVIVLVIYTFVRPIDDGLPVDKVVTVEPGTTAELWIQPMRPASRKLAVGWVVEKADAGVKAGAMAEGRAGDEGTIKKRLRVGDGAPGLRRGEGGAWRMPKGDPFESDKTKEGNPRESFTVGDNRLPPGRYKITAVARDLTDWVILDSQNLLVDWRSWIVEIK